MKKLRISLFLGIVFLILSIPVIHKALPIVRDKECYRSFFPKRQFSQRMQRGPEDWMIEQLNKDFVGIQEIHAESIEKTYAQICDHVGFVPEICHYRIIDNKLYKFTPKGAPFSDTDTRWEKALKTLLLEAKVDNCDFILAGVDGVPEHYFPDDFYLTEKEEDQAPILAQAKREKIASHHVVLIPDQLSLCELWKHAAEEVLNSGVYWEEKKSSAIWRGGLSDTGIPTDGRFAPHYEETPRFALCRLSLEHPQEVDAGFCGLDSKKMQEVAQGLGMLGSFLSKKEHLYSKYLPVLDGHMCTYPGYQWRLLSNSVCLKQESDQVQWFYKALKPYVHYIPVKEDMSDLLEQIQWAKNHDQEAQEIAQRASEFTRKNLMIEDDYFYLHLALREYAKRQVIDFHKLKAQMKSDSRWRCIQYRKRLALKKSWEKIKSKAIRSYIDQK